MGNGLAHERDEDVGCWRRLKRSARRAIKWNTMPMRVQMRTHLILLFGAYFVCYFVFLTLYTDLVYLKNLEEDVAN